MHCLVPTVLAFLYEIARWCKVTLNVPKEYAAQWRIFFFGPFTSRIEWKLLSLFSEQKIH